LHEAAGSNDPAVFARMQGDREMKGGALDEAARADLLEEAFIPVSPEVGRLLYILCRANNSKLIVEFGTSFGISTIYLACAARDNGGRVITTELSPSKARKASEHLAEAGVRDYVEIREGDALETLREVSGNVDFVLLDGWKNLYLPVLKLIEPKLRQGGIVVADDLDIFPEVHKPYLKYVRSPENGYLSVEVPMGDRLDLALRIV
jgi:predicted O-methyltransferase YrrM